MVIGHCIVMQQRTATTQDRTFCVDSRTSCVPWHWRCYLQPWALVNNQRIILASSKLVPAIANNLNLPVSLSAQPWTADAMSQFLGACRVACVGLISTNGECGPWLAPPAGYFLMRRRLCSVLQQQQPLPWHHECGAADHCWLGKWDWVGELLCSELVRISTSRRRRRRSFYLRRAVCLHLSLEPTIFSSSTHKRFQG